MFWIPVCVGILNAYLVLDLLVTICTGSSIDTLFVEGSGNSVAKAIIDNIPGDPATFWICCAAVLAVVGAIEYVMIYTAFYSDRGRKMEKMMKERCRCEDEVRR